MFFKWGHEFEKHYVNRIKNYDYRILGIHFLKINTKLKCCSISYRLLRHHLKRADPYNSRYSLGIPFSIEIILLPLSPLRKVPDIAQFPEQMAWEIKATTLETHLISMSFASKHQLELSLGGNDKSKITFSMSPCWCEHWF